MNKDEINGDTELKNLNQSDVERMNNNHHRMEEGKKWRQFLAAILCELIKLFVPN